MITKLATNAGSTTGMLCVCVRVCLWMRVGNRSVSTVLSVFYFGFVCVHASLLRVDALCTCARPTLLYLCISECEYVCAPVHIWGSCTPVWDNSTASGLVCCVWIIKVVSLIIKSSLSWWEPEEGDGARERGRERGIIVSAAGVHARSLLHRVLWLRCVMSTSLFCSLRSPT